MPNQIIHIGVVDDHLLVIDGVTKALQTNFNFKVEYTSTKGELFLQELPKLNLDVLLLDIHLTDIQGPEIAVQALKICPQLKIIALTGFDSPGHIRSMFQAGCKGYILKSTEREALCKAIETVFDGDVYIEEQLKEQYFKQLIPDNNSTILKEHLNERDLEILQLIYEEYTSQEIAKQLYLAVRTVEKYRLQLLQKLKVKNTAGLVKVAIEMGLVKRNGNQE